MKRAITLDDNAKKWRRTGDTYGPKTYRKKPRVPKYTKSAIQRAILASRETKAVHARLNESNLSTVGSSGFFPYAFPVPAVGAQSNQRVGTKISPIKLSLNWLIHNNSSTTLYVRMLVLRVRQGYMLPNAGIKDNLFEAAGSGVQDITLQGNLTDLIMAIDPSEFQIMYDQVHTFGQDTSGNAYPNRYVTCLLARRADGDENLGEAFEFSYDMRMYYKD